MEGCVSVTEGPFSVSDVKIREACMWKVFGDDSRVAKLGPPPKTDFRQRKANKNNLQVTAPDCVTVILIEIQAGADCQKITIT